jgi:hypothetical protein
MKTTLLILMLLTWTMGDCAAQQQEAHLPDVDLVRVSPGDRAQWAELSFDDAAWEAMPWYKVNPHDRLLWVRAHLQIPPGFDASTVPFGVSISAAASYEVFWNGTLIGRSGTPGATKQEEQAGLIDTSWFVPSDLVRAGHNVLALRMSAFHLDQELSAPIQRIVLSRYGASSMAHVYTWTLCAIGALLLGVVYFVAMFLSNRRDLSSLLLACLSLSVLLQSLVETMRLFVTYAYPFHILRVQAILAFCAVSSLLLVAYVSHRYARKWQWVLMLVTALCILACVWFVPGFDGKTLMLALSALLAGLLAAVAGIKERLRGAAGAAAALAAVIMLAILDAPNFVNQTYYVAMVALLLFLFAQQVLALRRAQREREQAELRSARLELELLKKQIQPHFLMNTLTALTELLESSPASAVAMVEALAEELRTISAVSGESTIPLSEELDLCRHHLKVMSLQKGTQFDLKSDNVDMDMRVPPGMLHTLVENALTHNRYGSGAILTLEQAPSAGARKVLRLRTPRTYRQAARGSRGTGHAYVRARLTEAFGRNWVFRSGPQGDDWLDEIEIGGVK